jgi:hypothetical protein
VASKTSASFIGRYTVREYSLVKQEMIRKHPELKHYKVEDVCRYIATKDWPRDRRETYIYAKNQGDAVAQSLQIYDECQELFDTTHHGEGWIRFYQELTSIPEANRTHESSLVKSAIARGSYTGPIPWNFRDLEKQDQVSDETIQ